MTTLRHSQSAQSVMMPALMSVVGSVVGMCAAAALAPQQAFGIPLPQELSQRWTEETAENAERPAPTREEITAAGVDFTAIVALNNCSGALVRFATSRAQDKALVLTNGHCYEGGFIKPGVALANKTSSRSFNLLSSNGDKKIATYRAERLMYATMTSTDMALYQLKTTFAEIKAATGVDALTMSARRPEINTPVRIVSGYWKTIYACSIQKFIPLLREGDWDSDDSFKYSQPGCKTKGGTSGSPIIHANTREVVGVNNTGNEDGERCTDQNPCEIDDAGNVVAEKGAAYGQQTYQIYSCLNSDNTLNLNRTGCTLPKNVQNE